MQRKSSRTKGAFRGRPPILGREADRDGLRLVVGLGNIGRRYSGTRHNAGFMTAHELLERTDEVRSGAWREGRLTLAEDEGERFLLLEPATFMNLSGAAVVPVLKTYEVVPERMIVVHDDIDIPLGEVRLKKGGGSGGHKGVASIADSVGSQEFLRVRVGVGRPPTGVDAADFVLRRFEEEELEEARLSISRAADKVLGLIRGETVV